MPAAQVVLVRHGEARVSVSRIVGGEHGCTGLTDTGRAPAAALRDRFVHTRELRPGVICTSTLPRAIETAEIVAEAFPYVTEVRRQRSLCEQEPGECDGMPFDEVPAKYGVDIDRDGPDVCMSPGGESTREFDTRVRRALDALVGAACMYTLHGPRLADVYPFRLRPANTSLTSFIASSAQPPWLLDRYNDAAHLSTT